MAKNIPILPSTKGKPGAIRDPVTKEKEIFEVEEEVRKTQSGKKDKILLLQKITFKNRRSGKNELRLGYYILGKKQAREGEWVWGQFATLMPVKDFISLYKQAELKGLLKK